MFVEYQRLFPKRLNCAGDRDKLNCAGDRDKLNCAGDRDKLNSAGDRDKLNSAGDRDKQMKITLPFHTPTYAQMCIYSKTVLNHSKD